MNINSDSLPPNPILPTNTTTTTTKSSSSRTKIPSESLQTASIKELASTHIKNGQLATTSTPPNSPVIKEKVIEKLKNEFTTMQKDEKWGSVKSLTDRALKIDNPEFALEVADTLATKMLDVEGDKQAPLSWAVKNIRFDVDQHYFEKGDKAMAKDVLDLISDKDFKSNKMNQNPKMLAAFGR